MIQAPHLSLLKSTSLSNIKKPIQDKLESYKNKNNYSKIKTMRFERALPEIESMYKGQIKKLNTEEMGKNTNTQLQKDIETLLNLTDKSTFEDYCDAILSNFQDQIVWRQSDDTQYKLYGKALISNSKRDNTEEELCTNTYHKQQLIAIENNCSLKETLFCKLLQLKNNPNKTIRVNCEEFLMMIKSLQDHSVVKNDTRTSMHLIRDCKVTDNNKDLNGKFVYLYSEIDDHPVNWSHVVYVTNTGSVIENDASKLGYTQNIETLMKEQGYEKARSFTQNEFLTGKEDKNEIHLEFLVKNSTKKEKSLFSSNNALSTTNSLSAKESANLGIICISSNSSFK